MESQKEQALHPLLLPLCVLVCGGAMIGVFRLLGKLDDSVLYGAALGCGICILNLFLLRFTMNRAAAAASPQAAQQIAKASVPPRLLLICVIFCFEKRGRAGGNLAPAEACPIKYGGLASPCQSSIPSPW